MSPNEYRKYAEIWYEQHWPDGNIPKGVFSNYVHSITHELTWELSNLLPQFLASIKAHSDQIAKLQKDIERRWSDETRRISKISSSSKSPKTRKRTKSRRSNRKAS